MFKNGQWVKFAAGDDLPEVHRTSDGMALGIYVKGGRVSRATVEGQPAADPEIVPDHVAPVDSNGLNIYRLIGPEAFQAKLDPTKLELTPVTDRNDIPAARLATMNPDWTPRV